MLRCPQPSDLGCPGCEPPQGQPLGCPRPPSLTPSRLLPPMGPEQSSLGRKDSLPAQRSSPCPQPRGGRCAGAGGRHKSPALLGHVGNRDRAQSKAGYRSPWKKGSQSSELQEDVGVSWGDQEACRGGGGEAAGRLGGSTGRAANRRHAAAPAARLQAGPRAPRPQPTGASTEAGLSSYRLIPVLSTLS